MQTGERSEDGAQEHVVRVVANGGAGKGLVSLDGGIDEWSAVLTHLPLLAITVDPRSV
jgi:hypothetical protein